MNPIDLVRADALGCSWEAPRYIFFSSEVESLVYYSHLFPVFATAVLLIIILVARPRPISNVVLIIVSLLFMGYALVDLLLWALIDPSQIMFFWSLLIYLEILIYAAIVYLVLTYANKKDTSITQKLLMGTLLLPLVILGPTSLNLLGFDYTNCDRLAIEGPLSNYLYCVELIFIFWIIGYTIHARKRITDNAHKRALTYLALGSFLFLFALSLGNIVGTLFQNSIGEQSWVIAQYGFFGMPVFLGFIAYIIVKFKAFNTKLIGAQALVLTLWVLVGSLLFIAKSAPTKVVALLTLVLVTIFGYFLVRSVKQEVALREQIEGLAVDLQKANDRLKILDKMKSEFVSIASHQLRSPLTSIRGYASMLLEGSYGKLPAKAKEAVERIGDSSRYMALSVEDYLNVSRIEAGNMKYENADFNLKEVTEKVVDEMRPAALKKGLVLVFRSDCNGSCSVHADIGKTRQVILNLVDNAMKYTPKGSITVVAHDDVKKMKMYVSIQDTGVGMSQETIHDVFEKFVRAKNANQINVTGTGLGLFVAKKMVEEMGGRIWAESEGEGKGSIFHFELPLIPGSYRR